MTVSFTALKKSLPVSYTHLDVYKRQTDTVSKAHEKGTRVAFYPEHFRLYSCSRGIQKPVPVTMTYGNLKKIVGETPPCYSHTTTIRDEQGSGEILNSITYEQYILKGEKHHE